MINRGAWTSAQARPRGSSGAAPCAAGRCDAAAPAAPTLHCRHHRQGHRCCRRCAHAPCRQRLPHLTTAISHATPCKRDGRRLKEIQCKCTAWWHAANRCCKHRCNCIQAFRRQIKSPSADDLAAGAKHLLLAAFGIPCAHQAGRTVLKARQLHLGMNSVQDFTGFSVP